MDPHIRKTYIANWPFPNCLLPLFQIEASWKTFHMKMSFICMWMETHFHMKGYAARLALKKRYKATRKWPLPICFKIKNAYTFNWYLHALFSGLSLTCYRCGGAAPTGNCSTVGSATVQCESLSLPNEVYGCQVYTVNYTTLNSVQEFKSKNTIKNN